MTKKWYIIDSESKGNYSQQNLIRFLTNSNDNTKIAFKNCAPFNKCRTEINETFVDEADIINITMPMYNLLEYSDNYSDTSGSLWNFKRDETEGDVDLTINNASSFKYKANLICDTVAVEQIVKKKK